MSQIPLKLVANDPTENKSLRFERRLALRHKLTGQVTSVLKSPDLRTQCNRICSLHLLNISDTGIGAIVQQTIEPGSEITVFFNPHGPERGFTRHGYVVRCTKQENAIQVGIEFDNKTAA